MGYACLNHSGLDPSNDSPPHLLPTALCASGFMLRPQHVRQERGTSLWVADELLSPGEFTWSRDGLADTRSLQPWGP